MLGGYCFFNNAAIVAEWLRREAGFARVAILDVDYHHGNGTQQIFWERGDVLYVSLHADPDRAYPYYSGFASERGSGDGDGRTLNVPLPAATGAGRVRHGAHRRGWRPSAHSRPTRRWCCRLGSIPSSATRSATWRCAPPTMASWGGWWGPAGRPVVALQEGGYAIDAIGANARAFLRGLRGEDA